MGIGNFKIPKGISSIANSVLNKKLGTAARAPESQGGDVVISSSVDQLLEALPLGSVSRAIGNNMYGINFRQTGNAIPKEKSSQGFVFFTRPQLNLSPLNITNYRGMYNLMTSSPFSYQRYTRMILDPRLGYNDQMKCPFVDNTNPFISMLTNNIISLSGWPDLMVPTTTSTTGLYGEEHSMVDGAINHFESFDLDATFRNSKGNPLIYFFYIWIKYQTLVYEGILNPYFDMIAENEIDYNTRIYRIVLDQQKKYITYIAATGASFPLNVPTGSLFDFNKETPYMTSNAEISIRFRCIGMISFEDRLKLDFNKTLAMFNPEFRNLLKQDLGNGPDSLKARDENGVIYRTPGGAYAKLPHSLAMTIDTDTFKGGFYQANHKALPYINLLTNELEWWIKDSAMNSDTIHENAKANNTTPLDSKSEAIRRIEATGVSNAANRDER